MSFVTAQLSLGSDDRCEVWIRPDRLVLAVADGAGNSQRGAHAAATVMEALRENIGRLDAAEILRRCDDTLAGSGGETTCVIAVVDAGGIRGAAVGDSGAFVFGQEVVELTAAQPRKPLIGSGQARPISFASGPLTGTLLLATDGLLKFVKPARIGEIAVETDLDLVPERLIASARLPSGKLQDDTTVVVCRRLI